VPLVPPAPSERPDPSAYGLPKGAWINEARQAAYVYQPGDYGAAVAKKFGRGPESVPLLVKANPQVKNWSTLPPGVDLNLPPDWRPVAAHEGTTKRPGPAAPLKK